MANHWRAVIKSLRGTARTCSVIWKELWWRADSYRLFKYRGGCNTVISAKWEVMWKVRRSPTLCPYWETVVDFKWQKQGSLSYILGLSEDGGPTPLCLKIPQWKAEKLKGGLWNAKVLGFTWCAAVGDWQRFWTSWYEAVLVAFSVRPESYNVRLRIWLSLLWCQTATKTLLWIQSLFPLYIC